MGPPSRRPGAGFLSQPHSDPQYKALFFLWPQFAQHVGRGGHSVPSLDIPGIRARVNIRLPGDVDSCAPFPRVPPPPFFSQLPFKMRFEKKGFSPNTKDENPRESNPFLLQKWKLRSGWGQGLSLCHLSRQGQSPSSGAWVWNQGPVGYRRACEGQTGVQISALPSSC